MGNKSCWKGFKGFFCPPNKDGEVTLDDVDKGFQKVIANITKVLIMLATGADVVAKSIDVFNDTEVKSGDLQQASGIISKIKVILETSGKTVASLQDITLTRVIRGDVNEDGKANTLDVLDAVLAALDVAQRIKAANIDPKVNEEMGKAIEVLSKIAAVAKIVAAPFLEANTNTNTNTSTTPAMAH